MARKPGPEPLLRCPVENESGIAVLRPTGTLAMSTVPLMRTAMLKSLAAQPIGIVVDIRSLVIGDELCLTVFAAVGRHAAAWPGCPVILVADPPVSPGLRVMAINRHVTICNTVDEAAANVAIPLVGTLVRESYRPRLASVTTARAFAAETCDRWRVGEAVGLIVQLAVTELVGNSVRHAGTQIDVVLRLTSRYVHVAVRDRSRRHPRLNGPVGPDEPGGRGLILLEALATAWGSTPTEDGKVTWATVLHTDT